jgi:hypothetical protein
VQSVTAGGINYKFPDAERLEHKQLWTNYTGLQNVRCFFVTQEK